MKSAIIHTDGGARGNPGPAGAGVIIFNDKGKVLKKTSKFLGRQTNNWAEYEAAIFGLETALELFGEKTKKTQFKIYLDSELVTRQINRQYKIKKEHLLRQFLKIEKIRNESFPYISFTHVRREENAHADALANEAMDRGV